MISITGTPCVIWSVNELCQSNHTSFVDHRGHVFIIGPKHVYDLTNMSMFLDNDSFKVQRFCNLEIKII